MAKQSDWSKWSQPQLRALLQLYVAVPVHETVLRWAKVRSSTITSLEYAGLLERIYLKEPGRISGMPFLVLTQQGRAVKRDYVLWHRELREKLGSLPPSMLSIVEARI